MKNVYCVELVRMQLKAISVEPVDEELRIFSSIKKAVAWLTNNGFVYGQRSFFNYPEDEKEWFHKDDICVEYVDAAIIEMSVNDLSESKFKNLKEIHSKCLPKSLKEFVEG